MQPLFNARTREKMIFCDDEFYAQLAMMAGSAGLEALAQARRDVPPVESPSFEVGNGANAYASQRLRPAEQAAWSFEIEPADATASFLVIFCPDGPNPVLEYVTGPADERGEIQGRYSANSNGILFFSWTNPSSWTGSSLYIDSWTIYVGGHAEDVTAQALTRRNSNRTQSQQRGARGCLGGCLTWPRKRKMSAKQGADPDSPLQQGKPEIAPPETLVERINSDELVGESDSQHTQKVGKAVKGSVLFNLPLLLVLILMLLLLQRLALLSN